MRRSAARENKSSDEIRSHKFKGNVVKFFMLLGFFVVLFFCSFFFFYSLALRVAPHVSCTVALCRGNKESKNHRGLPQLTSPQQQQQHTHTHTELYTHKGARCLSTDIRQTPCAPAHNQDDEAVKGQQDTQL